MRTAILLAAFVGLSSAHLAARDGSSATATAAAAATIVTNCVKPGTVALTFVRFLLLSVFQADTFVQDDGPYKYLSVDSLSFFDMYSPWGASTGQRSSISWEMLERRALFASVSIHCILSKINETKRPSN
jgi:hypothetical protein